jgi:hypothetical protein
MKRLLAVLPVAVLLASCAASPPGAGDRSTPFGYLVGSWTCSQGDVTGTFELNPDGTGSINLGPFISDFTMAPVDGGLRVNGQGFEDGSAVVLELPPTLSAAGEVSFEDPYGETYEVTYDASSGFLTSPSISGLTCERR